MFASAKNIIETRGRHTERQRRTPNAERATSGPALAAHLYATISRTKIVAERACLCVCVCAGHRFNPSAIKLTQKHLRSFAGQLRNLTRRRRCESILDRFKTRAFDSKSALALATGRRRRLHSKRDDADGPPKALDLSSWRQAAGEGMLRPRSPKGRLAKG